MFVLMMTQRSAEPSEQKLLSLQHDLEQRLGVDFPGSRASDPTAYKQVVGTSQHVVEAAMHAMRLQDWNVGIGVGGVAENSHGRLESSGVNEAVMALSLVFKKDTLVSVSI